MASLAALIMTKLAADVPAIVNTDAGRNIFKTKWPNLPHTAVKVDTNPGKGFHRVMRGGGSGIAAENHALQVMWRAFDLEDGDALGKLIFASLDNFVGTISGVRFLHIVANHPPAPLGEDESRRMMWSVNFDVKKEVG
jgi:hypothetical protein